VLKTIGLVAVRIKSSRLKNKATLDLNGKPLILRLLLRLRRCKNLTDIILCTSVHPDDQVLLKIADENGFKSFAGDEDDVMNRFIKAGEREHADTIVRITGDNPLTDPEIIDNMLESHLKNNADYSRVDNLPIGVTAEVISLVALKKAFELAEDSKSSEYMTLYFMNNPGVFKLNILQPNENAKRPQYRLTVDYQEDYELMKMIFSNFAQKEMFSIVDVVKFLDKNPEVAIINANVVQTEIDQSINTNLRIDQKDRGIK